MVRAGESSGMLDDILERLAVYMEKTGALRRKIKSALVYPAVVSCMAIAITLVLLLKVIPVFKEIYAGFGAKLPVPTMLLIGLSDILKRFFIFVVILAGGLIFLLRRYARTENGRLVWDYTPYRKKPENALVPLEVIFRFGVPEGSSLLKRTGNTDYCKAIGLDKSPKAGDTFDMPVVEFSTKLETSDRYLTYTEAQEIAGLSPEEFNDLSTLARLLALRLKDCFAGIDIELWDGKFEFAFTAKDKGGRRGFMLVDSIGPDELRLIRDGVHLSKEMLRGHYRPTPWYAAVEKAKELAEARGEKDWKKICTEELKLTPAPLSDATKEQVEMVYKGIVRDLSQKYCTQGKKREVA